MKILIFGGTTEGREIAERLAEENDVTVSTATEYGASLNPAGVKSVWGRLDIGEMTELMRGFDRVIDATHPYAEAATENIKKAAAAAKKQYERVERTVDAYDKKVYNSYEEIVAVLNGSEASALITTGANALDKFTAVKDFKKRLWIRILPVRESMERAWSLGYPPSRIIAAQGPFSEEMNTAVLRYTKARFLVTKNSGKTGGFREKVRATENTGARLLVLEREV